MLLSDPCTALMTPCFMWGFAMYALNCCAVSLLVFCFLTHFLHLGSRFQFANTMVKLAAVEALHYLELWMAAILMFSSY